MSDEDLQELKDACEELQDIEGDITGGNLYASGELEEAVRDLRKVKDRDGVEDLIDQIEEVREGLIQQATRAELALEESIENIQWFLGIQEDWEE